MWYQRTSATFASIVFKLCLTKTCVCEFNQLKLKSNICRFLEFLYVILRKKIYNCGAVCEMSENRCIIHILSWTIDMLGFIQLSTPNFVTISFYKYDGHAVYTKFVICNNP